MFRSFHEVSVKLALYSADAERVLVMHYPRRKTYGLPGGHVEKKEVPDEALQRELKEELGIQVPSATRKDFFLSEGTTGRIVLAYHATASRDLALNPPNASKEYGVWLTKEEFNAVAPISTQYKRFTLEYWPQQPSISV